MVDLVQYIQPEKKHLELNIALAGEIVLFSETNEMFTARREKVCEAFKRLVKSEMLTADYIKHTLVFKKYVKDLIIYYEKYIDTDAQISLSTTREIKQQIANSMVLNIRKYRTMEI